MVSRTDTKNITANTIHFGILGAVISGEMIAINIQEPQYESAVVAGVVRYQFFDHSMKKWIEGEVWFFMILGVQNCLLFGMESQGSSVKQQPLTRVVFH
jgi:hypothetical protein